MLTPGGGGEDLRRVVGLMTHKHLFIGIDGGASFCRARIRDMQRYLLGEGWGGPANIHLDLIVAAQSIRAASKAAVRAAGLDERSLHRAHAGLGLAGAGIKSASDGLHSKLGPFASVVLETDAYIAWLGAHRAADGGIVIPGTGSCGLAVVNGQRITVADMVPRCRMRQVASAWVGKHSAVHFGLSMGELTEQSFQHPYSSVSSGIPPKSFALLREPPRPTMPNLRRWSWSMHRRKIRSRLL